MDKSILTFDEWFSKESHFAEIFDKSPVLNMLFPDAAIQWMTTTEPALTPAICVFEEAWHKFNSRYVYIPYLNNSDNYGQVKRIQADIMYQSVSEWNRYTAIKEVLNSQLTFEKLKEILGNYSITKVGGYSDTYKAQGYEETDTWNREKDRTVKVSNFQSVEKSMSKTELTYKPETTNPPDTLTHKHTPSNTAGSNRRVYDGGTDDTDTPYYKEYGMKNGEFFKEYMAIIKDFPNAVDMFLTSTAQCYLTDVYNPHMWEDTLR